MKKRIFAILLTLCLVLALCPLTAFAKEPAPTLDVTIDGFEVGKTTADCTFSFESTIPGITFSKSDIQGVIWEQYEDEISDWWGIYGAFRANTRYRVLFSLNYTAQRRCR